MARTATGLLFAALVVVALAQENCLLNEECDGDSFCAGLVKACAPCSLCRLQGATGTPFQVTANGQSCAQVCSDVDTLNNDVFSFDGSGSGSGSGFEIGSGSGEFEFSGFGSGSGSESGSGSGEEGGSGEEVVTTTGSAETPISTVIPSTVEVEDGYGEGETKAILDGFADDDRSSNENGVVVGLSVAAGVLFVLLAVLAVIAYERRRRAASTILAPVYMGKKKLEMDIETQSMSSFGSDNSQKSLIHTV